VLNASFTNNSFYQYYSDAFASQPIAASVEQGRISRRKKKKKKRGKREKRRGTFCGSTARPATFRTLAFSGRRGDLSRNGKKKGGGRKGKKKKRAGPYTAGL